MNRATNIKTKSAAAVVAMLLLILDVPLVFAAVGGSLGVVDLTGNGGMSVGTTFDGTYCLAPLSGGGWASTAIQVYQPPVGGGGNATLVASKSIKDSSGNAVTIGATYLGH